MQVTIQIKNVFGTEKAYPVNDTAFAIAKIAGTKTLTRQSLAGVFALGLPIVEIDRYGRECSTFFARDAAMLPMVQ